MGFDPEKACLAGTRSDLLEQLIIWTCGPITSDDTPIFWIKGVAGSGKSALAQSVATMCHANGRLGSSFFFDISHQSERSHEYLFRNLSLDLADFDPQWKAALHNIVKDDRALRQTRSLGRQFEKFLVEPAKALKFVGPIVIVIDALDESGDPDARAELLKILSTRLSELPPNLRFLITSRPERDIETAFAWLKPGCSMDLRSIATSTVLADIRTYVVETLGYVRTLPARRWPSEEWITRLVNMSDGLFQWAYTACHYIKGSGKGGVTPYERLDRLLSSNILPGVDPLYKEILERLFPSDGPEAEDTLTRFKAVIGQIVCVREPLTRTAHLALRPEGEDEDTFDSVIGFMGSLLSGVSDSSVAIRPLHTSFREFLIDPKRSGPYYVDPSLHEGNLAASTLRVLNRELKFNICGLNTSYLRNSDVSDLPGRISKYISGQLQYSSVYWGVHLGKSESGEELQSALRDFVETNLLYWLEVLSIMKEFTAPSSSMEITKGWSQVGLNYIPSKRRALMCTVV